MLRIRHSSAPAWLIPPLAAAVLLLAAAAAPAQAAFPGTPGPIVYPRYSAEEDGSKGGLLAHGPRRNQASRQLTDEPGDEAPSFSADGRTVAFSSNRGPGDSLHIFVISRDGSHVRQVTEGEASDRDPSFSPDGKRIVFSRVVGFGAPRIFVVNVDGSGPRQITNEEGSDNDPVFTPNGRTIVFVSNRKSSGRRDRSNIFSMRPDGSHMRLLIGGPGSEYEPDISPNGRSIAFSSSRGRGGIFIARMNGRHVRFLRGSRSGGSPSWAPDGKHIAFLRFGSESSELVVKRADGRGFSKEFDSGGTEEEGYGSHVGAPTWGRVPR